MKRIICFLRRIIRSKLFDLFLMTVSCISPFFDFEVYVAMAFFVIGTIILLISDDISDLLLLFLLTVANITIRVDLAECFLKYWYIVLPVIPAFILHFIIYRKKIEIGSSFYGICAVAIAISMGGAFTIPASEYFSPSALFYTLSLGVGMILLYVLIKSDLTNKKDAKASAEHFAYCMYLLGIFVSVIVLSKYVKELSYVLETKKFLDILSRNNFATFLMIAMPFPAYFATKNKWHFLSLFGFEIAIFLTNSRGGLTFGSFELLLLLIYIFVYNKKSRKFLIVFYVILGIVGVAGFSGLIALYGSRLSNGLFSTSESRYKLLLRSFDDFLKNPVFGVGLGYTGNMDVFSCAIGEICWYHLLIPQIYASLGIVGIIAFSIQGFGRIKLWFRNKSVLTTALLFTNVGLTLIGLVNPGCFSPFPLELTSVIAFILIENIEKENLVAKQRGFLLCHIIRNNIENYYRTAENH